MNWTERLKEEFLSGWKPFEVVWVVIFLAAQIIAYVLMPDSPLGMISGITGILCVVLVSKGKISNYFFGLIFAYTYFYVSWGSNFLGEMNTALYVYIPSQFIGYFMWKQNMQNDNGGESVIARKALDCKKITKDIYNKIVQTAIDNYNQMKENREKSGGNYYNTMGSRLDGNFVKALCESISMGRTSYTEAYRLTNTSRKTFSEVAQHFGGMEW